MTPAELKRKVENTGSLHFTRNNMRWGGDTMANYGVRSAMVVPADGGDPVPCWELHRKAPTRCGLKGSCYFNKQTFEKVFV